jgi:flagellar M-ring protein FliF
LTGGSLRRSEVAGIVNLVATAVPGLEAERVSLVTTDGTTLHQPTPVGEEGKPVDELEKADLNLGHETRALEAILADRTRTMLERVMGEGHVDVRVRAELDAAKIERKSDKYDPKGSLRSEQRLFESRGPGVPNIEDTVAGVPGAESALPDGEGGPIVGEGDDQAGSRTTKRSHIRNFDISHVQERRISVVQSVKRLTVAVVVDGVEKVVDGEKTVVPRPPEEVAKLTALVRGAVGYDEDRGDVVTVESVPFNKPAAAAADKPAGLIDLVPPKYKKYAPLAAWAALGAAGTLLLVVLLFILKLKSRRNARQKRKEEQRQKLRELKESKLAKARGLLPGQEESEHADYRVEALQQAEESPATAALVMRHWLGTAGENAEDAKKAA